VRGGARLRSHAPGLALLGALASTAAFGWPPDKVLELEPGKEKFVRLGAVDWFEVDDPKLLTVEQLESGNALLVTGQKPGRPPLLAYAEGKPLVLTFWIGKPDLKPFEAALPAALKACPKLEYHPDAYEKLVGEVPDPKCQKALLELLKSDRLD